MRQRIDFSFGVIRANLAALELGHGHGRPYGSHFRQRIDDYHVLPRPFDRLAIRFEHPQTAAVLHGLFIYGIKQAVLIEKNIQCGRDADAALGSDRA